MHAKEPRSDQRNRESAKNGAVEPFEFDIRTRQIHAYLETFALLIKGGLASNHVLRNAAPLKKRNTSNHLAAFAVPPVRVVAVRPRNRCSSMSKQVQGERCKIALPETVNKKDSAGVWSTLIYKLRSPDSPKSQATIPLGNTGLSRSVNIQ